MFIVSACSDSEKWVTEETAYFYFDRPESWSFEGVIVEDLETSGTYKAYEAVGENGEKNVRIDGVLDLDLIQIKFYLANPKRTKISPSPCSDYSADFLNENGEYITTEGQKVRFVSNKKDNQLRYWLDLCVDDENCFFISAVNQQDYEQAKKVLLSIRMK